MKYGDRFYAKNGGETIKELLDAVDLEQNVQRRREVLKTATGQKRMRLETHLRCLPFIR